MSGQDAIEVAPRNGGWQRVGVQLLFANGRPPQSEWSLPLRAMRNAIRFGTSQRFSQAIAH